MNSERLWNDVKYPICENKQQEHFTQSPLSAHLCEGLFRDTQRNIVVVQHAGGRLDDVLRRLASTGETIVFAHCKILVATCTILQLKYLTWNNWMLFRHTRDQKSKRYRTYLC